MSPKSTRRHPPSYRVDLENPQVEGAPSECFSCGAPLCLRKQVVNLALGNTEEMFCLQCLAEENEQTPEDVLEGIMTYIQKRECFAKEWARYGSVEQCPDRKGCLPSVCFPKKQGG